MHMFEKSGNKNQKTDGKININLKKIIIAKEKYLFRRYERIMVSL